MPYPPPPAALSTPSGAAASVVKVREVRGKPRHFYVKLGVVTAVALIFLGAVFYVVRKWAPDVETTPFGTASRGGYSYAVRNLRGGEEKALTLSLDKAAWTPDKETKNRLRSLVAFKRADAAADAWLGIAIQDYGTRRPREGELLNAAIDRLTGLFGDSLQMSSSLDAAKFAGIDGWRTPFVGKINVVTWRGECYLIPHHGFGYLVFVATPTEEGLPAQIAELEAAKAIAFTTDRHGWTEQPPEVDDYAATDNAFSVKTPAKIWRENDPLTDDPNGVIYLSGHFQSTQIQPVELAIAKNATMLGVALDKTPDIREAFKKTREYLERKKQELAKDYQFAPLSDVAPFDGEAADVGIFPGRVGEMRLLRGKETMRYVVLAVFNEGPKTYGLRFECVWEHREIWRKEFRNLIKTIRPTKQ